MSSTITVSLYNKKPGDSRDKPVLFQSTKKDLLTCNCSKLYPDLDLPNAFYTNLKHIHLIIFSLMHDQSRSAVIPAQRVYHINAIIYSLGIHGFEHEGTPAAVSCIILNQLKALVWDEVFKYKH